MNTKLHSTSEPSQVDDLCEYERQVLQDLYAMNDQSGAAVNAALEVLAARGYCTSNYQPTQKGRDYLNGRR